MTMPNGGNTAEIISQGVLEAYAREGMIKNDGERDMPLLRERLTEHVLQARVHARGERNGKALSRSDMVAHVFPSLPGPDAWDEQPDPQLARSIYRKVSSQVWGELHPRAAGSVQRRVAISMGNGYVMCRYKIGNDQVDGVYITDSRDCITLDYITPENEADARARAVHTANREMLVMRQPQNAVWYAREYVKQLQVALTAAKEQLALAVESVTLREEEDEENGNGEGVDE